MSGYKGFIKNLKKGSLSTIVEDDIFVVDTPEKTYVETDPTVPSYVKDITQANIDFWNQGYQHPIKTWIDKINLSGNKVISNFTIDSLGHPTNWVTRDLTPSDIGALSTNKSISSISFSGTTTKTATITLVDGTTIEGTFNDISGTGADGYINSGSFNTSTGLVTLNNINGQTVTFNLDNRYSLIGHTHSWSQITGKPTLDNYDGWNLKTNGIQRIKVSSGGTADFVAGTNMTITYGAGGQVVFDAAGGTSGTYDNYQYWRLQTNAGAYTNIGSTNKINIIDGDLTEVVKTNVTGGANIQVNVLPKPILDLAYDGSNIINLYGSLYASKHWYNITGANPILVIQAINSVAGAEIEGSFTGTGRMTINAGSGLTLTYADEFFTNTYPAGGVWAVKFITTTHAVLFGKQIPIGI